MKKYQLYIPGLQFNNVAIVSKPNWKGSARKACSKGGKLKPSNPTNKAVKASFLSQLTSSSTRPRHRCAAPLTSGRGWLAWRYA
ncbi:MAG: hypothetical protein GY820_45425 [Gammaproteobacteria bacterium]|nr:hypothetical protein [Gammaproteobacteria bacterium]